MVEEKWWHENLRYLVASCVTRDRLSYTSKARLQMFQKRKQSRRHLVICIVKESQARTEPAESRVVG